MIVYLESSAAAKLLVSERHSKALVTYLDNLIDDDGRAVSSVLLETELRRLAVRERQPQVSVTQILQRLDIFDLDRDCYREAGLLPGIGLRSLDALHVAAALRLQTDAMLTYDERQAAAARECGLIVIAPIED